MIVLVAAVFEPRRYHITKFHIAECEGAEGVQRMALSLLADYKAAAAVEAWDGAKRVYLTNRPAINVA
jgi:hypothetical protein